ncbi:MAG: Leu/Phe/Val dehydrogenase [Porticoccaceae bacterium]
MFDAIERAGLAELHLRYDQASGLRAIIAIHNTHLGPALGGCRCLYYPSENAALADVAYLARSMSYKAALAGLPQGGGKAVIMLPNPLSQTNLDRTALYRAFGDFVDSLGGHYITAIDSGTELEDLSVVAERTRFVVGTARDGFDPSPVTAQGLLVAIRTAVQRQLQCASLTGIRVAIQGVGHVGKTLARLLSREGAHLLLSDNNSLRASALVREIGGEVVAPEAIYDARCDVFAPCGLGGILNAETIPRLRCQVVAGCANNQLQSDEDAERLAERGILYAPDYVINAGGLILVSMAYHGRIEEVPARVEAIATTLEEIFERAAKWGITTVAVADHMATERLSGEAVSHAHCG